MSHHSHFLKTISSPNVTVEVIPTHFEVTQKHLEIEFVPEVNKDTGITFRDVTEIEWKAILEKTNCHFINRFSFEHYDSYVFTESTNILVYERKIILNASGLTTPFESIQMILAVAKHLQFEVERVVYSRTSYDKPEKQLFPHKSFEDEVMVLDQFFEGEGYVLGAAKGDKKWFLYITKSDVSATLKKHRMMHQSNHHHHHQKHDGGNNENDRHLQNQNHQNELINTESNNNNDNNNNNNTKAEHKIEIIMHHIDPEISSLNPKSQEFLETLQISKIIPNYVTASSHPSSQPSGYTLIVQPNNNNNHHSAAQLFSQNISSVNNLDNGGGDDGDDDNINSNNNDDALSENGSGGSGSGSDSSEEGSRNNFEYYALSLLPGAHFSYSKLETNIIVSDYTRLVSCVFDIFKPKRAIVAIHINQFADCKDVSSALTVADIQDYKLLSKSAYEFGERGNYACWHFLLN